MRRPAPSIYAAVNLVALFCVLLFAANLANADDKVQLVNIGCDDMDSESFIDLLSIEHKLRTGPRVIENMTVELRCEKDQVQITIDDKLTRKRLMRIVPNTGREKPGWERELALVVIQLYVASWLELVVPEDESAGEQEVEPASEEEKGAVEDARAIANSAMTPDWKTMRISLAGGMRYRSIDIKMPSFYVAARGGGWLTSRVGLFADLAFETGRFQTDLGEAKAVSGLIGVSLAWRNVFTEKFILELAPTLLIGYTNLEGDMPNENVEGSSQGGVAGEFALQISPVFQLKRVMLSPKLLVGYMIGNPVGYINTDQTDEVSLGGLTLGITMELGFLFS